MAKTQATILIIDDDEDVLLSAKLLLKKQYTTIITRNNPKEINQLISIEPIDVVILDMNYRIGFNDGKEGMYWLNHVLSINPKMIVILMTAYGEVELAVDAIKKGAFDFILKPWSNEKFLATIHAGLELSKSNHKISILESTNEALEKNINQKFGVIIGKSKPMQQVMNTIAKVSPTDASILILGENGTGKQHLAREIHKQSEQKNGPFIHVDLGSLSENLFESELFGHKKGSFTDAHEDKPGRFEMAENGTLFLDEIGNLPFNLQSKLLTVLQDRKVSRLGEGIERPFNTRLLFATNAPLNQWVAEGKFRQDLLFRINTVEIEIPPLRKRPEDIDEFVIYYLNFFKSKYHKSHLKIDSEAMKMLRTHHWPGNVREIQHTLERGVIMSDGQEIKTSDFNLTTIPVTKSTSSEFDDLNLQNIEKILIQKAIEKHEGNISKAAKELGLTRAALYRRLEKFNL
ncbi:sigma-54-dependent transcriptional regulator [Lutibacter flavus]|uniref:DNA-binding transcriptional response regulator, NtrC family, contains REC, AAA-type ATPase, and a Fis-type DNA-binding domains n=1 Tax=Lutibacter flavus TaxID=691689 RepID=A0A238XD11_9FLAO|nr:sigma-54 dependent transcriptional regulator [Lutibacter flavus]SNR56532.1 DNA-binding transcriptional response regulator, NtrC family, contains REC, AAA-type ATPase, and a Fis-type DNA-binding domains [Lutibacter flavus]